ncbi:hypothetical protein PVAP13_4NG265711 [Panicum virgatum]|uniref:Uncharacterized protein n=1 Tax=Panicum virgatum TaxID=38727 RepID=A0A8T0T8E2_PANVG|nr:hypothetical protein PVAP13_4NG265711 [Panicum virgatum]
MVVVPVFIACDAHVHALRVVCFLFPGDDLRPGPAVGLPVAALLRGRGQVDLYPDIRGREVAVRPLSTHILAPCPAAAPHSSTQPSASTTPTAPPSMLLQPASF